MKLITTGQYTKMVQLELFSNSREIANAVKATPKFASLGTQADAILAKATLAETQHAERKKMEDDLKKLILRDITNHEELQGMIEELAVDAEAISLDPQDLIGLHFTLQKTPEPVGQLGKVLDVRLEPGDDAGTGKIRWKSMKGAQLYQVQMTDGDPNGNTWKLLTADKKCKLLLEGLTSGKNNWVRVRAKGAAGWGPWSDPAKAMIP
ncbi:MAG: fibronectin type III domain-containing protein [Verrucomicrobiota bacterium]